MLYNIISSCYYTPRCNTNHRHVVCMISDLTFLENFTNFFCGTACQAVSDKPRSWKQNKQIYHFAKEQVSYVKKPCNEVSYTCIPIWKGWIPRLKTVEVRTNGKQLACHTQQNLIRKLATLTIPSVSVNVSGSGSSQWKSIDGDAWKSIPSIFKRLHWLALATNARCGKGIKQ